MIVRTSYTPEQGDTVWVVIAGATYCGTVSWVGIGPLEGTFYIHDANGNIHAAHVSNMVSYMQGEKRVSV